MSRLFLLIIAAFTVSACSRTEVAKPTTAEDIQIARQALPVSEVSLMLRGGYSEQSVIAEIKRRRVPEKIDGATEDKLVSSGASPALIATLKSEENVLTANQKTAYDEFKADKTALHIQTVETREVEQIEQARERSREQRRQQNLQTQTVQNIYRNEQREASYQQASRAYELRKKSLESQIKSIQTDINQYRRYNYKESQLRTLNERREDLEKQLRDLTPPLR